MPGRILLNLLIICVIWSQVITGSVADKEIRESSDNLIREKRVINHIQGEDELVPISRIPYIVGIKEYARIKCVGSILSQHVAITAAPCVVDELGYHVVSDTNHLQNGIEHNVTNIKRRFGGHPRRPADGIALLTVHPPFVFGPHCNRIGLHSEPLLQGLVGTVSGWGCRPTINNPGTSHPMSLRSIEVPIMKHRDCVNRYRPLIQISDVDICTYHQQKHCGNIDGGAPLVIDGQLAGVHLWTGPARIQYDPEYPDVFAVLQHPVYIQWIISNI